MMLFIPVVVFEERRGASLVGNRASSLKVTRSVASGRRLEGGILGATLKHFEVIRLLCPFQNLLEVPYHNPNIFPLKLTRVGGGGVVPPLRITQNTAYICLNSSIWHE